LSGGDGIEGVPHPVADEVLVTGASGFLGCRLVDALVAGGRQVIAMARRPPLRAPQIAATTGPAPVRWVYGDIRDPLSYLPHLRPGLTVFHLAALRTAEARQSRDLEAVNVAACRDLARHGLARGVHRFVFVATAHLYGPSVRGVARREADGPAVPGCQPAVAGAGEEPALGCYESSRGAALLEVRRLATEGLNAVTLCPAILFGPDNPSHRNLVTNELRRIVRGRRKVAVLIAGGAATRELVHVDDIVSAALAAERLAPPGAELLLGGEAISHRQLIERSLALAGQRAAHLTLSVPGSAALAAARAADRLLRHDPGCGLAAAVRRSVQEWRFDSARARALLGYRPRALDEGLAMTLSWLRRQESAA
jgi:dihydroflavonol-4-reductase